MWPFNYISNFKVRAMHRNNVVKNPIHFVTENLFIKYKIAANINFVNKVEKVHKVANFKK